MEACLDTAMGQGDKAQAEPQAEMHCLVVDDESLSRTVGANLLRKFSFKGGHSLRSSRRAAGTEAPAA